MSGIQTHRSSVVDIWRSRKNYLGKVSVPLEKPKIADYLASAFCPGDHYYFIVDSTSLAMEVVSPSVKSILGIEPDEFSVESFAERVHPDDYAFVLRCEDMVGHFLQNCIPTEKKTRYKVSYSLRLNTRKQGYRVFLTQWLVLQACPEGSLLKIFGVHSDIGHITPIPKRKLSFIGLEGEPSFLDIDVLSNQAFEDYQPYPLPESPMPYTSREMDIIRLLGSGLSTADIASQLNISAQTVNTHRKNLLRKSGCNNATELVVQCLKAGYI